MSDDAPSRFHSSPAEIDAFLREHFAEDALLNFYRAVGDEVLDEALTHGKQHRGVMESRNCKHLYLAGMDDVMEEIWDYRYYPAKLPQMGIYKTAFAQKTPARSLHPRDSTRHPDHTRLPSPKLPLIVTIREVPGGWDAMAEDGELARPVASAITYAALQAKLAALSATYQITVTNPESMADLPVLEPDSSPCFRTKTHDPHKWLKGRKAVQCPGTPKETP